MSSGIDQDVLSSNIDRDILIANVLKAAWNLLEGPGPVGSSCNEEYTEITIKKRNDLRVALFKVDEIEPTLKDMAAI